jgi:hypothetical protein
MHSLSRRVSAAALIAASFIVVPAHAAGRRRAVSPPTAGNKLTAALVSGVVLDDVTGQPVAGIKVRAGNKSDTTGTDGKFEMKNITSYHGLIVVDTDRSGYTASALELKTGGTHQLTLRVKPTPTVRMRKTDGTTVDIDFESAEFGYPIAFSGYNSATYDDFCKPNGTRAQIDRTQIRRIIGPASKVTQAACCPDKQLLKITAELKSGETTDLFFEDTCTGIPSIDFIGRNHVTGKMEYTPFTSISEITFPATTSSAKAKARAAGH